MNDSDSTSDMNDSDSTSDINDSDSASDMNDSNSTSDVDEASTENFINFGISQNEYAKLIRDGSLPTPQPSSRKKRKHESSISFSDDAIPENLLPIGGDVFLDVKTSFGVPLVHIKRYLKRGKNYYYTPGMLTLIPSWVEHLIGREKVPQYEYELLPAFNGPRDQLQITTNDFTNFTILRVIFNSGDTDFTQAITISASQWSTMISQYESISSIVLDHVFRAKDFLDSYTSLEEVTTIPESLQMTRDTCLGTEYLMEVLKNAFLELLTDDGYGDLKESEIYGESIVGCRLQNFNSVAYDMNITELAADFRGTLLKNKEFLQKTPIMYVSREFLKNVQLDTILRDMRNIFCPSGTNVYFDEIEYEDDELCELYV